MNIQMQGVQKFKSIIALTVERDSVSGFQQGEHCNPFSKRACEGCTIIQERLNQFVLIQDSSFLVYKYVMDRSVYLELWLNQVFAIIWRPFVIFLLRQCNFFVASNVILMTF
eukprot:TRINITY_DN1756_c0_g1_i1.p5 TRINITY_DN1756_c0_g1~~TRINITY_DN1756_c0_g1_i1.p5  ORF type:complete len:112 (-),score=1.20 TRINITY_DN1756_c0_g1_i1:288-623(-)